MVDDFENTRIDTELLTRNFSKSDVSLETIDSVNSLNTGKGTLPWEMTYPQIVCSMSILVFLFTSNHRLVFGFRRWEIVNRFINDLSWLNFAFLYFHMTFSETLKRTTSRTTVGVKLLDLVVQSHSVTWHCQPREWSLATCIAWASQTTVWLVQPGHMVTCHSQPMAWFLPFEWLVLPS